MAEIARPELCIIGAGALGIALAQHARRLNATVTLVDRGVPEPGDGPQRTLRVASLTASASAAAAMRAGPRLGLAAGDPKVSLKSVQERARQVVAERQPLDSRERLGALGIDVVVGPAQFTDPATLKVGDTAIKARSYILAVGGTAIVPTIPGLDVADFFTAESLLDNTRKLTHVLVIGADAEGFALAQAYARMGSQVTLVPQGWALADYDLETASILMQALAHDGVHVLDGAKVRNVQPRSQGIGAVVDLADGGEVALDLSHLLVCDGQAANLAGLGLDAAAVRPLRGQTGRYASGALGQTSNRKVRVVGAAAGIDQWQQALSHGRSVVEALLVGTPRHRPSLQPRLILTEPALAQFGRLPGQAGKLAPGHALHRTNLGENDLARALGAGPGLIKVLCDSRGRVVGASLVGAGAGELAGVLTLAKDRGVPLDALADLPLPHPSLMASLAGLGESRLEGRKVTSWEKQRGALRRMLGL